MLIDELQKQVDMYTQVAQLTATHVMHEGSAKNLCKAHLGLSVNRRTLTIGKFCLQHALRKDQLAWAGGQVPNFWALLNTCPQSLTEAFKQVTNFYDHFLTRTISPHQTANAQEKRLILLRLLSFPVVLQLGYAASVASSGLCPRQLMLFSFEMCLQLVCFKADSVSGPGSCGRQGGATCLAPHATCKVCNFGLSL